MFISRIIIVIFALTAFGACSHMENVNFTGNETVDIASKLKDATLADLIQHVAYSEIAYKREAAYRIGAIALERNNQIVQSKLNGTECPGKADLLAALPALTAALRSEDDKLQYEAAGAIMAIGPQDEASSNALSSLAASPDNDIKRALKDYVYYLFTPPCDCAAKPLDTQPL